ncbi:MAG: methyltransferase, partial [Deinococcota bacterium]
MRVARLGTRLEGLHALTKPGVRGFPEVDAAQALLAQTMRKDRVKGEVLDLSALGGLLASLPGVTLRAVEGSAAALTVLTRAGLDPLAAVPGDDLGIRWPERARTVALVLAADRGNAYAAAQIAWAHACTPPGGTLYLAGDRDKGFDRYVRAAARAFGTGETIARDGGMRVAKLVRRPGPTPAYPDPEGYEAFGVKVVGLPGVFSAAKPDKATTLLLSTLEELDLTGLDLTGRRVLDLGCGTGLMGAWAARRGAQATLVDGDLQSVRSAQATLAANRLPGEVFLSDVDTALGERTFDVILTNPPFHVGRGVVLDVAREFIAAA